MSAAQSGPSESPRRRGRNAIVITLLTAIVLAGGLIAGLNMADPTSSDEYQSAMDRIRTVESERNSYHRQLEKLTATHEELLGELEDRADALAARESAVGKKEAEVEEASEKVTAREKAVGEAEAQAQATTVEDGTWTVGDDIQPGTYRTKATVGTRCYWGVYRSGTNGSDIIQNDIPGGGKPTVKLSKGQDFKSSNCGSWIKK